ncbi:MAG TPA: polysaccharide deacetylase family protein [Spirochaetota bacterium]|nr:polysaccharide deacetylase family protein [Spirochaetota bacterium]HPI89368.1 polysaccharide deacetylase family protein [Spirochaetota bacterium]HPR48287.1 polysaccharide deacetylase family protein [Spirochaetota bacterium]
MSTKRLTVVQCWDDGVCTDIRLVEVLRRYGAAASFNLCAGLHRNKRSFGWAHAGADVYRLGWDEMRDVYQGFAIANHSMSHPRLDLIAPDAAEREIREGRERLQQFFGQSVSGFAYPFGAYNETLRRLVRDAGHAYARTCESADDVFPPQDAMRFHPTCHFLAPDFWQKYEQARQCGVFYFWGHSYEILTNAMWQDFELTIQRISDDPHSRWGEVGGLFDNRSFE